MSSVEVNIFGRKLSLEINDSSREYIDSIVSYVNDTIHSMKERSENCDETTIAILACLNIADLLLSENDSDEEKEEALEKLKSLSERSIHLIKMIEEADVNNKLEN